MYYTNLEHMAKLYDQCDKEYAFKATTKQEFEEWKKKAKQRLIEITGMDFCTKCELTPKCHKVEEKDGYTQEYWTIQTEPEVIMPFYLLKPNNSMGKTMIMPNAHGSGKEGSIIDETAPNIQKRLEWFKPTEDKKFFSYKDLLKAGYNVVCPDARGSGERREFMHQGDTAEKYAANSHREIFHMAIGFGQAPIGLFTWDLMRLVDFLETQECIDKDHIGAIGISGGGEQSIWLAAIDERIKLAVTSGYFYGMKEAFVLLPQNCSCNFIPYMWRTMDMGDIGAMIAPRGLLVESGTKDPLCGKSGIENVYPQVETARKAYRLMGLEDKLVHTVHNGGHEWCGRDIMKFLEENL